MANCPQLNQKHIYFYISSRSATITEAETGHKMGQMGQLLELTWTWPNGTIIDNSDQTGTRNHLAVDNSLNLKDQTGVFGKVPMPLFFWFWAERQRFLLQDFEYSEDSNSRVEVAKECIWYLVYTGIAKVKDMHNYGPSGPSIIDSHALKQGPTACILARGPKLPATFRDSVFFHCDSAGSPKNIVNSPDLLEELGVRLGRLITCIHIHSSIWLIQNIV